MCFELNGFVYTRYPVGAELEHSLACHEDGNGIVFLVLQYSQLVTALIKNPTSSRALQREGAAVH